MKKFISFLVLASSVAFVSCKKEAPDFTTENGGDGKDVKYVEMTFGANIEEADSNAAPESGADVKATLDPNDFHIVLWEKDDKLNVYPENTAATTDISAQLFQRVGTGASTSASFSGVLTASSEEGYYCTVVKKTNKNTFRPLGYSKSEEAGSFNGTIPETQKPVRGGVAPGAITMVGWCEPGSTSFDVYNTCGFIKVTVAGKETPSHRIASITVSTSAKGDGKVNDNHGTTISGAQRFNFTGRSIYPHGVNFIYPGDFRNSGANYIKMLPNGTEETIAPGTYFLVASPATGNGKTTGLSAEFFITVEDTDGNKALLHASGIRIYRNRILAMPAIDPDKLVWTAAGSSLVSNVSDFTATPDGTDGIAISGTLNVFPNTADGSGCNWVVMYKDQSDQGAVWKETNLSGTGTAISGKVNAGASGMMLGKEYSLRVKVNGGQCYSVIKDVIPGSLVVSYDHNNSKNGFELEDSNTSEAPEYPVNSPKDVEYPAGSGYFWTFTGKWWNQANKVCSSSSVINTGLYQALGLPAIENYKLAYATFDNAEAGNDRETYICNSNNITNLTKRDDCLVSEIFTILAGESHRFEIIPEKSFVNTRYYIVKSTRITKIELTYLYCPSGGTDE